MSKLTDFFWFCSGADRATLKRCPTDANKYAGIGGTVFFTAILAFIAATYAMYTVYDSVLWSLLFGIVWGLMIFNLDRFIVSSMKNRGNFYRDFAVAVPRIAIAVVIAMVIAKPLELKIFDKEIQAELITMEQEKFLEQENQIRERYVPEIQAHMAEVERLKAMEADKTRQRDDLAAAALAEADGTGGSQIRNMGPIYKAKKAEADKAQAELNALLAENATAKEQHRVEAQEKQAAIDAEIASLTRVPYNGFAARIEAMNRLTESSAAMYWAHLFIVLLLICIETAPVFVKLISYRSPYDYVLHKHEHQFQMNHELHTGQLRNHTANQMRYNSEIGTHRVLTSIGAEKELIEHQVRKRIDELKNESYDWRQAFR